MRSPKDMGIIEIDITNACVHSCANCTRFCGHHKKNFFMDFETFKRAVDSLEGYDGMVGIIGGEPTLHPEFEKMVTYLRETRLKKKLMLARGPIENMQFHIDTTVDRGTSKAVLLSTLSRGYYKNFEVINDTFDYQLLNDHSSNSEHQALLMSRKELGISDKEWIKKRNDCWIQNAWSATITPKGAFFCEVAGALDMLFDGPGGWPIEEGWYKRTPEEFVEQLEWCELCSACLDAPKRLSHDERDDVTPEMMEKLIKVGSPKALNDRCVVRDPKKFNEYKSETYKTGSEYIQAGGLIRTTKDNRNLYPKNIFVLENDMPNIGDRMKEADDWVLITEGSQKEDLLSFINDRIWNPGCFYEIDNAFFFNIHSLACRTHMNGFDSIGSIQRVYRDDKYVYVDSQDELLFLLGGELKSNRKKYLRQGKKLLVFGAGSIGGLVVKRLQKKGYNDFSVVVSDKTQKNPSEIMGCVVYNVEEFLPEKEKYVVVVATRGLVKDEVKNYLDNLGFFYCDLA